MLLCVHVIVIVCAVSVFELCFRKKMASATSKAVAIVTGTNSGLGLSMAVKLAASHRVSKAGVGHTHFHENVIVHVPCHVRILAIIIIQYCIVHTVSCTSVTNSSARS